MKKSLKEWLYLIGCGAIGALFVTYGYFKVRLLIEIWRAVCR